MVTSTHGNVCFSINYLERVSEHHQTATLELDQQVHRTAENLEDTTLLGQMSVGDMKMTLHLYSCWQTSSHHYTTKMEQLKTELE